MCKGYDKVIDDNYEIHFEKRLDNIFKMANNKIIISEMN